MNTNAKHTPGPYAARRIGQPTRILEIFAAGFPIAKVYESATPFATKGETERAEATASLLAAAPALLEALRYAAELIPTARRYFPKSVKFSDRFQLENVCATIGKAITQAEGGAQ